MRQKSMLCDNCHSEAKFAQNLPRLLLPIRKLLPSKGFGSEITAELVRLTAQKNCDQEAEAQRDPQC
jgi:hypothetical protein